MIENLSSAKIQISSESDKSRSEVGVKAAEGRFN